MTTSGTRSMLDTSRSALYVAPATRRCPQQRARRVGPSTPAIPATDSVSARFDAGDPSTLTTIRTAGRIERLGSG